MSESAYDPYAAKAAFFDAQADADWASRPYGPEECDKLERLFAVTGPLNGLRVLEPGCGTGRLTEVLAAGVGPAGRVVATDVSPRMTAEARKRLAGFGNVAISQGRVEDKTGFAGYFDLVVCHQVFPHFADPGGVLLKLAAMLRPGGRLAIFHFIYSAEINRVHRAAGSAVAQDLMPSPERFQLWCGLCRLAIEAWHDDDQGYLLAARLTSGEGSAPAKPRGFIR